MYSSVPTPSSDARPDRDSINIGKSRQSVLLCAWIACVFVFAVMAARMFYGADTTGGLSQADGRLRTTPGSTEQSNRTARKRPSGQVFRDSQNHAAVEVRESSQQIQQVAYRSSPQPASTFTVSNPDSFYGHHPSAPGLSGHARHGDPSGQASSNSPDRSSTDPATSGHSSRSAGPSYSILPDHVRNQSRAAARTPAARTPAARTPAATGPAATRPAATRPRKSQLVIPIEKRNPNGPYWSQLPTRIADQTATVSSSAFSQVPAHRLKQQQQRKLPPPPQGDFEAPLQGSQTSNRTAADPSVFLQQLSTRSPYSGYQYRFDPAARISAFPVAPVISPIQPEASREKAPFGPLPVERQPAPGSLKAHSISSTAQPDGFLTIPSGDDAGLGSVPYQGATTIEPPIAAAPTESYPSQYQQQPQYQQPPYQQPQYPHQPPPYHQQHQQQQLYQRAPQHSGWSGFDTAAATGNTLWWEPYVSQPLLSDRAVMNLTLGECLNLAQTQAPELQVLHSDWYIQQAEADRLAAAFDWNTFVEAIWNRDSTPVGSQLDGATNRLRSRTASGTFGVRRLTETGSQLEISQQFGTRSGNSIFLNPNPQANSRLQFDYEKPLLRGFGQGYNTSPQRLAMIERDTAYDRFRIGVQDYLLNVSSGYWTLVLQRGTYLQNRAALQRVQRIADEMAARTEVDVTPGMLDRAQSEVATRKARLIQSQHDVLRTQEALLRLIYGSEFHRYANQEVVTMTLPMPKSVPVQPTTKVQLALQQRSEVHQAIREIKAATIRYEVAANEVLPALNLVLSGYVAGLQGGDGIGTAWKNQFNQGEPGVGIGFDFEVPYRNRAAEAAAERQQVTIKRMQAALQTAIADVAQDVRNQVIERNKYGAMLDDQREAIRRARSMLKNANIRRENLADGSQVADLYLEDLLQIQSRLEGAELAYLQSQVRYTLADNALLRAISDIDSIASEAVPPTTPVPVPDNHVFSTPIPEPAASGYSFGQ